MTIHAEKIITMYDKARKMEDNQVDRSFSGDTIVRVWPDFVQTSVGAGSQENRRAPRVRGLLTSELVQDNEISRILQQANVMLECVHEKNRGMGYRITGDDKVLGRHADALIEAVTPMLPPDQMRLVRERYQKKLEETVELRTGVIQLGSGKKACLLKDGSIKYPEDMTIDDADTLYTHMVNHAYAKPGVAGWFQVDKKPSALAAELCKKIQEKTGKGETLTVAEQLYQTHGVKSLVRFGVGTLDVQQTVDPIVLVKDPISGNLKAFDY